MGVRLSLLLLCFYITGLFIGSYGLFLLLYPSFVSIHYDLYILLVYIQHDIIAFTVCLYTSQQKKPIFDFRGIYLNSGISHHQLIGIELCSDQL